VTTRNAKTEIIINFLARTFITEGLTLTKISFRSLTIAFLRILKGLSLLLVMLLSELLVLLKGKNSLEDDLCKEKKEVRQRCLGRNWHIPP
jgi:hypothetical protein